MSYADYQIALAPPWLLDEVGTAWLEGLGVAKDGVVDLAVQSVKARIVETAPSDGLTKIGSERGLERGYQESEATYRARLADAWNAWVWAGTKKGVVDQLAVAGFNAIVYENHEWAPDGDYSQWWRFWVVIHGPFPFATPPWFIGDGKHIGDSGLLVGSLEFEAAAAQTRRIIATWKPAHARCVAIEFQFSGVLIGGGWAIGDGTTVGGAFGYA